MRFMVLDWQAELDRARAELAEFLRAPADQLVFLPNATYGVATALSSARVEAGDELLTTDHAYRACKNQLSGSPRRAAPDVVVADLPCRSTPGPLSTQSPAPSRRARASRCSTTSPRRPRSCCRSPSSSPLDLRGVQVLVDGAHAPGQIPSTSPRSPPAYLVHRQQSQVDVHAEGLRLPSRSPTTARPLVTSHGASPEYGPPEPPARRARLERHRPSGGAPHGADRARHRRGRRRRVACNVRAQPRAGVRDAAPARRWLAHTAARARRRTRLHGRGPDPAPRPTPRRARLDTQLLRDGWEVPIVDFARGPLVRVSAHLYNHAGEADLLAAKLPALGVIPADLGTPAPAWLAALHVDLGTARASICPRAAACVPR